jgi:hypothetical protein
MSRVYMQFQIRAFRKDGELSAYLVIPAASVDEATGQAQRLISHDTPKAEVWSDGTLVDTIDD